MKLISHGGQVLPLFTELTMRVYVLRLGLSVLVMMRYPTANKGFMNALVEKWHQETTSFHLLAGEMIVTLNDVSCLLHLPVIGRPIDHVPSTFNRKVVKILLLTYLNIPTEEEVITVINAGAKVRLTWQANLYHRYVQSRSYMQATISYLLHLVGNMIFADKSLTCVHVTYLLYLGNLDDYHQYAWGVATLAYLYDHFFCVSQYTSNQVGGFMTLVMLSKQLFNCAYLYFIFFTIVINFFLQFCVFVHLPTIGYFKFGCSG